MPSLALLDHHHPSIFNIPEMEYAFMHISISMPKAYITPNCMNLKQINIHNYFIYAYYDVISRYNVAI
jgi:hypothetical protein